MSAEEGRNGEGQVSINGANAFVVIQALGSLFQFLYTNKIL